MSHEAAKEVAFTIYMIQERVASMPVEKPAAIVPVSSSTQVPVLADNETLA